MLASSTCVGAPWECSDLAGGLDDSLRGRRSRSHMPHSDGEQMRPGARAASMHIVLGGIEQLSRRWHHRIEDSALH